MKNISFLIFVGSFWIWMSPFNIKSIIVVALLLLRPDKYYTVTYKHYMSFALLLFFGGEFFLFRDDDWYKQWGRLKFELGFLFYSISVLMHWTKFKPKLFVNFWAIMSMLFLFENTISSFSTLAIISVITLLLVVILSKLQSKSSWVALLSFLLVLGPLSYGFIKLRPKLRWSNNYNQSQDNSIGFNRTTDLSSFASLFSDPKEDKLQLILIGKDNPGYMGAQAYDTYKKGKWYNTSKSDTIYALGARNNYFDFVIDPISADSNKWIVFPEYKGANDWIFTPSSYYQVSVLTDSLFEQNGRYLYHFKSNPTPYYLLASGQDTSFSFSSYSQIPKQITDYFKTSADTLTVQNYVKALTKYFYQNFSYSLDLPKPIDKKIDPVLHFLNVKVGYCEYFASTATLFLQNQGIPARLVKGFAFPNQISKNEWSYTSRKAHAWVEYYDNGRWITWDPTPPSFVPNIAPNSQLSKKWQSMIFFFKKTLFKWKNGEWVTNLQSFVENLPPETSYLSLLPLVLLFLLRKQWKSQLKTVDNWLNKYQVSQFKNQPLLSQLNQLSPYLNKAEQKTAKKIADRYRQKRFKSFK